MLYVLQRAKEEIQGNSIYKSNADCNALQKKTLM